MVGSLRPGRLPGPLAGYSLAFLCFVAIASLPGSLASYLQSGECKGKGKDCTGKGAQNMMLPSILLMFTHGL